VSGTDFLLFPPLPFSPQRHRNPLPERPDLDLRQTFDPPHHPDSYRVCLVENGALSGGGEQGCKSSDPQLHPSCSAVLQDHPLYHTTERTVHRFVLSPSLPFLVLLRLILFLAQVLFSSSVSVRLPHLSLRLAAVQD
jgi:hypothetical protein